MCVLSFTSYKITRNLPEWISNPQNDVLLWRNDSRFHPEPCAVAIEANGMKDGADQYHASPMVFTQATSWSIMMEQTLCKNTKGWLLLLLMPFKRAISH
ncbi:hypothetical protein CEXT_739881 [Caerostris extrusa]|uniref:Uncharacterized protein n=1 Tax=Caerostris extrusa TaxID=172846 RepID=A0AAV4T8Y2_CAEEX|nr:hypothetical protein CEXT_739881 [Caerostris extrusa]